jgi:hypothetical protein
MDKGLATADQAPRLVHIYEQLAHEEMPRYLEVAGWSAAEAALVGKQYPQLQRLNLLDAAQNCWTRAAQAQHSINERPGQHRLAEYTKPLRMAFNVAMMPLLKSVVGGNVTERECRIAFENAMDIAMHNDWLRNQARERGDIAAMQDYDGFGHECNALLAINRRLSPTRFMIPSLGRSDSGQYLLNQTHDLMFVHQQWGEIRSVTPVEIKGRVSNGDRKRYRALLVRGIMNICHNVYSPSEVLGAIRDSYFDSSDETSTLIADSATNEIVAMLRDYCSAEKLRVGTHETVTKFRNGTRLYEKYGTVGTVAVKSLRLNS